MKQTPRTSRANQDAPAARVTRDEGAQEYARTDQEVIDEDFRVTIYKSGASSKWYVQYNHPAEGQ